MIVVLDINAERRKSALNNQVKMSVKYINILHSWIRFIIPISNMMPVESACW